MSLEYRVVWKRAGLRIKRKRYASGVLAERFAALLQQAEPWKMRGQNPDEPFCCSGYQCGCGGITVREEYAQRFSDMPALEWVRIDTREVAAWREAPRQGAAAAPRHIDATPPATGNAEALSPEVVIPHKEAP